MDSTVRDARCKIIWGDSPDSVKTFLQEQNLSEEQANGLLTSLLEERHEAVRRKGMSKAIKGFLTAAVCGGFLLWYFCNLDLHTSSGGTTRRGGGLAIPGLGLIWGLWTGTDGLLMLLSPSKHKGDVGIATN